MAQNPTMNAIWRTIAIIVGGLFVFAGVVKLVQFQPFGWVDPMEFARDIDNYKMLPWAVSVRLALFLPWLEVICGLALIFRRLYSGALALILGLMSVFIVASIVAKARGIDITCGCFGHISNQISFVWHMVLDFAILGALAALWFAGRSRAEITETV